MQPSHPEVMAPAGNAECLRAALRAGADAVYFGLGAFNARARAENFREEELGAVMRELHERAVRGYVTLNTLVLDEELEELERAVRACARAGVDAVIVQDPGAAALVRAVAPSLPIHASTQMTASDAASVEVARRWGARRVTLARELSLADIAALVATTDVELEIFVHGALCISYSGQCFASLAFGGRSGNRGACAQACRLPYDAVLDGESHTGPSGPFLLSPNDLDASALVAALASLGVAALKIEGRLKGPDYVFAATRLYRRAVDQLGRAPGGEGERAVRQARHDAQQIFSRGAGEGHLAGIDHARLVGGASSDHVGVPVGSVTRLAGGGWRGSIGVALTAPVERGLGLLVLGGEAVPGLELGGRLWEIYDANGRSLPRGEPGQTVALWLGPEMADAERPVPVGARVFVTNDPRLSRELERERSSRDRPVPLVMRLTGRIGEPARLAGYCPRDGRRAEVRLGAVTERARAEAATTDRVREKLGQLGTTPFVLDRCEIDLPADAFVPDGALKRARRALVEALGAQALRSHEQTALRAGELRARALDRLCALPTRAARLPPGLVVLCRRADQVEAALEAGARSVALELARTGLFPFSAPEAGAPSPGPGGGGRRGQAERLARLIHDRGAECLLALPRIAQPGDGSLDRFVAALGPDTLLVRHLGALTERAGEPRIADHSFNVTNVPSALAVLELGATAFTPALDLDADRVAALLDSPLATRAEVIVYHHMPLFHTQHCLFAALTGAGSSCARCPAPCLGRSLELRDRRGARHPVSVDLHGRTTIHEDRARWALGRLPQLVRAGVPRFRIELTTEPPTTVGALVRAIGELVAGTLEPAAAEQTIARALRPTDDQAIARRAP